MDMKWTVLCQLSNHFTHDDGCWCSTRHSDTEPESAQLGAYHQWRPWSPMLCPYTPLTNPYQVTLKYVIIMRYMHRPLWESEWLTVGSEIALGLGYMGSEGWQLLLNWHQHKWYEMSKLTLPHIVLRTLMTLNSYKPWVRDYITLGLLIEHRHQF